MKKGMALIWLLAVLLSGCQGPAPTEPSAAETLAPATQAATSPSTAEMTEATLPPPVEADVFVRVRDYIPDIQVELPYATADNFTGQVIYGFSDAWLRYGTVKKLEEVQGFLRQQGLSLKIWDAYRPVAAQQRLWEVYPDGNFVANPNTGYSAHSRGNTLDVTIVDENGQELEMPTGFDDFSPLADRDYSDCPLLAAENARLLESVMEQKGFRGYQKEWWHFTDTDSYEVELEFQP